MYCIFVISGRKSECIQLLHIGRGEQNFILIVYNANKRSICANPALIGGDRADLKNIVCVFIDVCISKFLSVTSRILFSFGTSKGLILMLCNNSVIDVFLTWSDSAARFVYISIDQFRPTSGVRCIPVILKSITWEIRNGCNDPSRPVQFRSLWLSW